MNVQCLFLLTMVVLPHLSADVVIPFNHMHHNMPIQPIQQHKPMYFPDLILDTELDYTQDEQPINWDIDDVLKYEDIGDLESDMDLKAVFERYRLHTFARSWFDAASICWREGGRLATPVDAAEARTLGRLVDVLAQANVTNSEMRDFMHIGIHNLEMKSYLSTTEGDKAPYIRLQEGEEFKKTEQTCGVILANGHFMLQPCIQALTFACDNTPPPQKTEMDSSKYGMSGGEGFKFMSDGHPYRLHLQPLPWLEAARACEIEGGRLAVPQSERHAGLLAGLVFSCGHLAPQTLLDEGLFMGINDIGLEGRWRNLAGIYFDVKLWKDGSPAVNRSANCAVISSSGQFIDVSCTEPKPYICELTHVLGENPHYVEVEGIGRYAVHVSGKPWLNAAAQCRSENASLAVPNSREEAKALEKLQIDIAKSFPGFGSSQVFIGVHDMDRSRRIRTLDGQTLSETGYSDWYTINGIIVNHDAICVGLRDGKLITLDCAEEHMFICEKPLETNKDEVMVDEETDLVSNI